MRQAFYKQRGTVGETNKGTMRRSWKGGLSDGGGEQESEKNRYIGDG